jgi:hypothetical protein
MKTLLLVIITLLNWALTFGVQLADRRRLSTTQRAAAWNTASWGAAVYWFGFMSMVPWAWVTRQQWRTWRARGLNEALARSLLLLVYGVIAAAALAALLLLAEAGLATALDVKLE